MLAMKQKHAEWACALHPRWPRPALASSGFFARGFPCPPCIADPVSLFLMSIIRLSGLMKRVDLTDA